MVSAPGGLPTAPEAVRESAQQVRREGRRIEQNPEAAVFISEGRKCATTGKQMPRNELN
jgi:hypothetical protein